jgi:uncharacterized protein (TIGR02597 family)
MPLHKNNNIQTIARVVYTVALLFIGKSTLHAESVSSEPIGINKINCPVNSDTIVGVPFRPIGSINTQLSSSPTIAGGGESATLSLSVNNLTPSSITSHYVKFDGGSRDGRWYDITANGANSITINLNGDNLTGVLAGNKLVIARYWTLSTLFPPAQATTAWTLNSGVRTPNGHAIVNSASVSISQRRTQLFLPNISGNGINRSPEVSFFITGGNWRSPGITGTHNDRIIYPDTYMIIRHNGSVLHPTIFRSFGEIEMKNFVIPLATNTTTSRDTYLSIPRAVDVRLDQLNLVESGAFLSSSSVSVRDRKDQLFIFDNQTMLVNKSPSQAYFYTNGNWRTTGNTNSQNHVIIPAGTGVVIRKHRTSTGATSFWNNLPSY